jgi:hypothetical protein
MAIDEIEDPSSPFSSRATSYTLWVESHLAPTSGSPLVWRTWLADTLWNEVPAAGLTKFIKTLSLARPELGRKMFVQNRLKALDEAILEVVCDFTPPIPGT